MKVKMKISRCSATIAVLAAALIASNAWWFYSALDAGVTAAYRDQVLQEHHQALAELLEVAPVASDPAASRESVLDAARLAAIGTTEYEKDGYVWVGMLGYRFDDLGRLRDVQTAWSPF